MKMIRQKYSNSSQEGAVSLFVVVFAALLITVVVVSFLRIVINDQQQASTVDLSQSAYDSAQAGVEDGKRVLIMQQNLCSQDPGSKACSDITNELEAADQKCNATLANLPSLSISNGEVAVQQNANDSKLDQAYTCVKVTPDTPNYLGVGQSDSSRLIPLVGKEAFDTVQIEWYTNDDLKSSSGSTVSLSSASISEFPLLSQASWPANRPSIMRAQFMQVGDGSGGFTIADFDNVSGGGISDVNTIFLYPVGTAAKKIPIGPLSANYTKDLLGNDIRKTQTGSPKAATCLNSLTSGGYACMVRLTLPGPINGGNRMKAFLRLTPLYNGAHYSVSLMSGTKTVLFDNVQPEIDSTGRANDLFRRVKTRVELRDVNFPYPDAAVNITGNFCKDFLITDNSADYINSCTP